MTFSPLDPGPVEFDRLRILGSFSSWRRLVRSEDYVWSDDDREGLMEMLNYFESYLTADMELLDAVKRLVPYETLVKLMGAKLALAYRRTL